MPLIVHAFGSYACYGNAEIAWRQDDYNVNKLVKALKDVDFKGHADIRDVDGRVRRLVATNRDIAFSLFAHWAAVRLRALGLGPIVLVPVPSSFCIAFDAVTTPVRMAQAVQPLLGNTCTVQSWLRFRQVMPKSHEGGTRNQGTIEASLVLSPEARPARVVLIDDVKTTGAHLRACAAVLRRAGAQVDTVIVAATSVWEQVPLPLQLPPVDIEPVFNPDDW